MPSTTTEPRTLAARMGGWSTRHRGLAIALWLTFVVAAVVAGSLTGTAHPKGDGGVGQAGRADAILADHQPDESVESILVQRRGGGPVRIADARRATAALRATIATAPGVKSVDDPLRGRGTTVSADGGSALVRVVMRGDVEANADRVEAVERRVRAVAAAHPDLRIGQFGAASAEKEISSIYGDDFRKAETLSLPITLLILVLAFGAFVAAGVPVLLALTAVAATIGLIGPVSQLVPMDEAVTSVVLLVGMAVGVDYALFYLRREREERRRGASPQEALRIASATSGRAVLVSGLTVITAMSGMLLAGDPTFVSLGVGSMLVVAAAMLGSLTVLPAVLSLLGDRVEKGRVPVLHRLMRRRAVRTGAAGGGWDRILTPVLKHPVIAAVSSTAVLVVVAIPAFSMHTATTSIDQIPRTIEPMRVYDRMQAAFPGGQIPAVVVVHGDDVTTPAARARIADLQRRALATGVMHGPVTVSVTPDRRAAQVEIPSDGSGTDDVSVNALRVLREDVVPKAFPKDAPVQALVTGQAAESADFNSLMSSRAPYIFAFVLTLAFVLMLVTFRSIIVPIKAIVLNLLSVGAAYGVLVWTFQYGHLESVLGFTAPGFVTSWLPMFLFVILFGLSMDYHVFILSRIREAVDGGHATQDAVSIGIRSTAGTVTSAAVVMVAVFGIFATLSVPDFKQMGVGLATAILIDATIVRAILLPATMTLLGERNWYLPSWLQWLPQVRSHEAPPAAADEVQAGSAEDARELVRA